MAAGDLITTVLWEHEVNGYLIGPTWCVGNVTGWLGKRTKSADVELTLADGSVSGPDFNGPRLITLDLYLDPTISEDEADAFDAAADLEAAWVTATSDVQLHAYLPTLGHVYVVGRCRDLVIDDYTQTPWGRLEAQAFFYCGDPTIHTVVAP